MTDRWLRDEWLDAMWDSVSLSPNQRAVAYAFFRYAGKKGVTWCPWKELHRRTGIKSRDGISRAIRGLLDGGWLLEVDRARQYYSARYLLVIPDVQESGTQTPEKSGRQTAEGPSSPFPDTSSPFPDASSPFGGPDSSNNPSNTPFQPGGHAAPQTPLRGDDPSGHLNDQGDLPTSVVTDELALTTEPTTRARRENVVELTSRIRKRGTA